MGGVWGLFTCVGSDLQGLTEVSIASSSPGSHVEHIGSQRVQAFDICVPGSRPNYAIASLILILHSRKVIWQK